MKLEYEDGFVTVVYLKKGLTEIVTLELYNTVAKERRAETLLLFGGVSGGLFILAAVFITYSVKKKRAVYNELKASENHDLEQVGGVYQDYNNDLKQSDDNYKGKNDDYNQSEK